MEEVAMALELSAGINSGLHTKSFTELSAYVAQASNRLQSVSKPITGSSVLTHESGIHTNCLLKDRNTYQLIPAERVGRKEDDFLIGKHSGKATLIHYLNEAHLPVDDNVCKQLLTDIKEKAEILKRSITKEELFGLYTEIYSRKKKFSANYKL